MQLATPFATPAAPLEEQAFSLAALAKQWGGEAVTRLRQAHGDAFFLHLGELASERQPQGSLRTMSYDLRPGNNPTACSVISTGYVYPVKATGRCPFPNFVSIGRTRNNDVVLPDLSVSKFHAYLRPEAGHYQIHDAGSQNGTWIGDRRLGQKDSVTLEAQLILRFGGLELTYLDAASLHQLLARLI